MTIVVIQADQPKYVIRNDAWQLAALRLDTLAEKITPNLPSNALTGNSPRYGQRPSQ